MTIYAQLTDTAGNAVLEAAKPFEDFAVSLVGVLVRSAGRLPSPSMATLPVLVAEQVAALSNLLSDQRDFLTQLHAASMPGAVAVPKAVRVKRPATRIAATPVTDAAR